MYVHALFLLVQAFLMGDKELRQLCSYSFTCTRICVRFCMCDYRASCVGSTQWLKKPKVQASNAHTCIAITTCMWYWNYTYVVDIFYWTERRLLTHFLAKLVRVCICKFIHAGLLCSHGDQSGHPAFATPAPDRPVQ